tara:strand:- start:2306 stop:3166 length:861 start_codon:yes stop_codon:yes gene_type:complete
MKRLFEFTVSKKEKVSRTVKDVNKEGLEVDVIKQVEEDTPYTFFIRKPNRKMLDEGELQYGVALAEAIRAGMITRPLLSKRYTQDGGILADFQSKALEDLTGDLRTNYEKQEKIESISLNKRSEEEVKNLETLKKEVKPLSEILRRYNMAEESLFDDTAESRARNKAILWWIINLGYAEKKEGGKTSETPFFEGESYEEKLDRYDEIMDSEDLFLGQVTTEFSYNVSLWYYARPNSKEQFEDMLKRIKEEDDEEEESEVSPKEDVKPSPTESPKPEVVTPPSKKQS